MRQFLFLCSFPSLFVFLPVELSACAYVHLLAGVDKSLLDGWYAFFLLDSLFYPGDL